MPTVNESVQPLEGAAKAATDGEQPRQTAKTKSRAKKSEGGQAVKRRCVSTACIACRKRKSKVRWNSCFRRRGALLLIFLFDSVTETLLVVLPVLLSTILLVSLPTCSPRLCLNKFQVFTIPTLTTAEKESTNKILQISKTAIVRCKRLSRQS